MNTTAASHTPASELCERLVTCGSIVLNAASGPRNGPPLLLLHGVTRTWRDWHPVLAALMTDWQVFALDHRGHGRSQRVPGGYRVADFAEDALAFLRTHIGERAVLWGHSLGALTAALVAARAPECVRALVLEDPPGDSLAGAFCESRHALQFTGIQRLLAERLDAPALAQRLATLPVQHPKDGRIVELRALRDEAALRFAAECLVQMDPAVLDALLAGRWLEGPNWFGELARIQCPTLLLRADVDCGGMLSAGEAERIAKSIARCRLIDRPALGHSLHSIDPAGTLALVRDFLASSQTPA